MKITYYFLILAAVTGLFCATYAQACPPLQVSCSASPNSTNVNQNVTFSTSLSGGQSGVNYYYDWTGACTGSNSTCTNSFSNAGTQTAHVKVDGGAFSASADCPVTINEQCHMPTVNLTATPSTFVSSTSNSSTVTVPLNATPTITLTSSNATSCSVDGAGTGVHDASGATGTSWVTEPIVNGRIFTAVCTSACGQTSYFLYINNTTPNLTASCSANPSSITTGQSSTFTANVSGGTGSYNYSWSGACSGAGSTCSNTFQNSGTQTANLTVTSGSQTATASCPVNVNQATQNLTVSCLANPSSIQTGQSSTFTTNVSGGTGSYNYNWSGACSGSSANCSNTFNTAGTQTASVTVTSGSQTQTATCPVYVNQTTSNLYVSCYATPNPVSYGQSASFIPNVSGGTGNYTYSWSGACTGSSQVCSAVLSQSGTQTASVVVTSGSQTTSATCQVSVNQNCTTQSYERCNGNNLYWYDSCGNQGALIQYCSNGCSNNSCQNNNCITQSYERCNGNNLYWYDSCGNQGTLIQYCPNGCSGNSCQNNNCTTQSYERCNGNNLYWYDSCGNQGALIQYCPNGCSNNSCQNYINNNAYLTATKTVRDLTTSTSFASSTYANPSDVLMFMITLQNTSSQDAQNVYVHDQLPNNLIYNNQLVVARTNNSYNNYSGDIISGLNLNTISAGQTVTVTYQVQVASAQNFGFGTTTLNNVVTTTSSNAGYVPQAQASVIVTRSQVLGASTVSTGLTNNFWVDSFFLPFLLALIGIFMWRSGIFFGIEKWMDNKKKARKSFKAEKELSLRIENIKRAN